MAEVDGRACKRDAPNVCDARLQFGIDKADIDLLIELVDDLGGCVLGNADAIPLAEQELGWIEGHNYQFEYRWPDNNPELVKNQAVELAALAPDVLVVGTALAVSTLRRETSTIPIVFVNVGDPVGGGLISSLARTGTNITGFTAFEYKTAGKWLELLKEIASSEGCVCIWGTRVRPNR
jgi:hypothetical protein